jgi:UDP-glucose 4-epimerase
VIRLANIKEKCLVIGGSGFLGLNLIAKLLAEQFEVKVLYRNKHNIRKYITGEVQEIEGDLADRKIIRKAIKGIDTIFYLASSTNVTSSINDVFMDNTNIVHALNVLEEIKYSNIKKIVFASSGGTVYGEPQYLPIDENHITKPISPYGITKLSIENYLAFYNIKYGLDYLICRYSNPYGKYQNPDSGVGAISIFLYKYFLNDEIVIFGNPQNIVRDYIYIDDVMDATIQLAFAKDLKYKIFNVGSGVGTSLQQIIETIEEVVRGKLKIHLKEEKKENVSKVILDIKRINEEINWYPTFDIKKGIEMTSKWIYWLIKKN